MKKVNAINIIRTCLNEMKEAEHLYIEQVQFVERILDDLLYCKKVQNKSIEHFKEICPDMFG